MYKLYNVTMYTNVIISQLTILQSLRICPTNYNDPAMIMIIEIGYIVSTVREGW